MIYQYRGMKWEARRIRRWWRPWRSTPFLVALGPASPEEKLKLPHLYPTPMHWKARETFHVKHFWERLHRLFSRFF